MGDFNATSKFRVNLLHSDGSTDRVSVQIGLDGLKVMDANTGRTMRSYELGHISRWQSRGSSLLLYTRTPVDVEERQLTLQGDDHTIRSALDTLTCSCMQLAELLQSKQSQNDQETANSLVSLVSGGGKKKTKLPSADDVEYWRSPDKAGWLMSQGEVMKTWRKRWFVLKQGYLFRFMTNTVTESTKPRGVVDLSKVQDVKPATSATGKPNSIQLKTASGGAVAYVCDTETEMVEWISALDGAIQKIVKTLAGVEDELPAPTTRTTAAAKKSSSSDPSAEWIRQLEKNFDNLSTSSATGGAGGGGHGGRSHGSSSSHRERDHRDRDHYGSGGGGSGFNGNAIVEVVGYEGGGGGMGGRSGGASGRDGGYGSSGRDRDGAYGSGGGGGGGSGLGYGSIAGVAGVAGGLSADTLLNYTDYNGRGGGGVNEYGRSNSGYGQGNGYGQPHTSNNGAGGGGYGGSSGYGAPAAQLQHSSYSQPAQYGAYGAQQQQPQPQHGGGASLIDAVPHSSPAYPYYQQGMTAPASSAPAVSSQWQVHHTPEGKPYFYNTATGVTQWEAPPGM